MADRPDDQNVFSIRGLSEPYRRAREVSQLHPPGSGNLVLTHIDPHASWLRQGFQAWEDDSEDLLTRIIVLNGPQMDRVSKAMMLALPQATGLVGHETGQAAIGLVIGLWPLFKSIALWSGGGAVLGGVGATALAGLETAPVGAGLGFDFGMWIGGIWGIKDLLVGMVQNLGRFYEFASDGVELAWYAGKDRGSSETADMADAAQFFASALAELWMAFLTALIAYVMSKVAKGVTDKLKLRAQVGEVAKTLAESKLPSGFGEWFDENFDDIQKAADKWRDTRAKEKGDKGAGTQSNTTANGAATKFSSISNSQADPGAAKATKGKYLNFNPKGGTTNCGACSDAVDNYRAGKGFQPAAEGPKGWPTNTVAPWDFQTNPAAIETGLQTAGDGARGIVNVSDGAMAHVFYVENHGGVINAIDGQTGMEGSITDVADSAGYSGVALKWGYAPTYLPPKP